MPSLRSNKNLRALLPYPVTEERVCVGVSIPDDPQWIAAFYGQLYRLGLQSIWDRDDAHTAKDIAAVWMQVYRDTLGGSCLPDDQCDPCLERLLYDPATGRIGWNTDIGFYRVPDGPWTEPPLEPTWPPPQPYTTGTDPDRRCIASRNAALVLRQFYQETWGVFIDSTVGVALQLSTTLFQATAALFSVAFGSNILLEAARALIENATAFADPFPDADVETVQCILYCNSSIDAEGVVTFDFDAVVSEFGAQGTDPFGGLNFLLQLYLHEDGLNAAGGIHNEDEADCLTCPCETAWEYTFDFLTTNGGFFGVRVKNSNGTDFCGSDTTNPTWVVGVGWRMRRNHKQVGLSFADAFITDFDVTYNLSANSGVPAFEAEFLNNNNGQPFHRGNGVGGFSTSTTASGTFTQTNVPVGAIANELAFLKCTASDNFSTVRSITIRGDGFNPFI